MGSKAAEIIDPTRQILIPPLGISETKFMNVKRGGPLADEDCSWTFYINLQDGDTQVFFDNNIRRRKSLSDIDRYSGPLPYRFKLPGKDLQHPAKTTK
jgi:hypothetical protein